MLFTVASVLLLPIALDAGRVRLTILLPIIRMLFAPLACALPARLAVVRIASELRPAVVGTALLLALGIAADGLRELIWGRGEGLEAVRTAPLDHKGVVAFPRRGDLETELESLPRPRQWPAWSHWLRLTPAKMAPFFTGTNKLQPPTDSWQAIRLQHYESVAAH